MRDGNSAPGMGMSKAATRVLGAVVNHIPTDRDPQDHEHALKARGLTTLACIRTNPEFTRRRVGDVVRELGLQVVNPGDQQRRVQDVAIAAQAVPGFLDALQPGRLIVVPGDRHDVLLSAASC